MSVAHRHVPVPRRDQHTNTKKNKKNKNKGKKVAQGGNKENHPIVIGKGDAKKMKRTWQSIHLFRK